MRLRAVEQARVWVSEGVVGARMADRVIDYVRWASRIEARVMLAIYSYTMDSRLGNGSLETGLWLYRADHG